MADHQEKEIKQGGTFSSKFVLPIILLLGLFLLFYNINKRSHHHNHAGHGQHAETGHGDDMGSHGDGDEHHDHAHDHDSSSGESDGNQENDAETTVYIKDDLGFANGSWAWSIQNYLANGVGSAKYDLDKIPFEGEEISAQGKEQLDNLANLMKAYPDVNIVINGHSRLGDNAIEKTTNKATSKARALWVQNKLANRGVSGKQMKAKGLGGDDLLQEVDPKDISQRRISIVFEK